MPALLDDVFGDKVRVHFSHRAFSRAGEIIIVRHGDKSLAAVARGSLQNSRSTIQLDLRSRQKLGLRPGASAEFIFESAGWVDEYVWAWSATDAMPRIAARVGLISLTMGIVGLLLGTLSLF